jgi:hypothetical protein
LSHSAHRLRLHDHYHLGIVAFSKGKPEAIFPENAASDNAGGGLLSVRCRPI